MKQPNFTPLTFAELSFNASHTPVSTQFDDIYFSTQDGLAESRYVFQEGNQLWQRWLNHTLPFFVVAETGFGTGLNFLALHHLFTQFKTENPTHILKRLYFISFEKYPLTSAQLEQIHALYPEFSTTSSTLLAHWQPRQMGCQRYHFGEIYLDLWFGDLSDNLPQLGDSYNDSIDAWFLDGFSPDKNPEMWSEALFQQMFRLSRKGGTFATFTAASFVRRGLQAAGFSVHKRKGFGKKREMLWGEKPLTSPDTPLLEPYYHQESASFDVNHPSEIAIVGGGVASFFVALALLEKGKNITLYCQDPAPAANASGNLQGAVYPQLSDDDPRNVRFYLHSFDYALQKFAQISPPIAFERGFSGVALCGYNEKAMKKLQKIAEQGWDSTLFELCNAEKLSEHLGLTVPNGGAFIPQGGWLSPVQLVQNGFRYLESRGVKLMFNHHVESPKFQQNKWRWQYQDREFEADILILANGHQMKQFAHMEQIPLYPVRGQVSHIQSNQTLQKLKAVLCYDGYLTPASQGNFHCLGASHLRDNADTAFSEQEQTENVAKLIQSQQQASWTQSLTFCENAGKVGIRSAFRDRLPAVGIMPNFSAQQAQYQKLALQKQRQQAVKKAENVAHCYLIAGLGSRGLTTAPLLGEILASLICGEPIPLSKDILNGLNPNRFWMRRWLKG